MAVLPSPSIEKNTVLRQAQHKRERVDIQAAAARTASQIMSTTCSTCPASSPSAITRIRGSVPDGRMTKIGRAECRERVCPYVWLSVVDVTLKKTTKKIQHQL